MLLASTQGKAQTHRRLLSRPSRWRLEVGEEGEIEIFKFKEDVNKDVSSTKKRSTQTEQGFPEWEIAECIGLEKSEEDPTTLAWIDELVGRNAENHDQIDAVYLCGTVAGGTLGNVNVAAKPLQCGRP